MKLNFLFRCVFNGIFSKWGQNAPDRPNFYLNGKKSWLPISVIGNVGNVISSPVQMISDLLEQLASSLLVSTIITINLFQTCQYLGTRSHRIGSLQEVDFLVCLYCMQCCRHVLSQCVYERHSPPWKYSKWRAFILMTNHCESWRGSSCAESQNKDIQKCNFHYKTVRRFHRNSWRPCS
jgi:hypothetical protein